ncbi:hypothetical protein [Mesorhizobium ventifaucium]|uniref:Uncharacterized protein n=1 Tax=Mesorhizobium ventifaucium TaxID=666020 RepID=A0ABM9EFE3_9HYPH|nr:hypothetical protein [Mesorhizobium ventifaucium]CAH2408006.1 conserved hypothetical protein [Mesorhizobium ventifaucium]
MFNRKQAPTTDASDIPSVEEISPRLAEIATLRTALGQESASLRQEEFILAQEDGPELVDGAREARVAAILGLAPKTVTAPRSQRRQQIATRLRDIEEAGDILAREVTTERNRATAVIKDRLMPEYKRQIRGLLDALIAAHTAQVEIRNFASQVEDAGYNTGWLDAHPCRWLDIGPNSNIGRFVDEKRKAGFIADRDIPGELK